MADAIIHPVPPKRRSSAGVSPRARWTFAIAFALILIAWCPEMSAGDSGPSSKDSQSGGSNPALDSGPQLDRDRSQGYWENLESERRANPGGNHTTAAVDAYLRGLDALDSNDPHRALEYFERSAHFDLDFLPAQYRLIHVYALQEPARTVEAVRAFLQIFRRDYQAQRWLVANSILGLCLALTIASLAIALGLLGRHARALHHTMKETLAHALRMEKGAGILALFVLAMPFFADLGILVSIFFLLFLVAYRFGRGERVLALGAGAWALLVAPILLVSSPWWTPSADGRDAVLISEAQQAPLSSPLQSRVQEWINEGERIDVALYLSGLADKVQGDGSRAVDFYRRAAGSGEIPPWVLENNIGNALMDSGEREAALLRYARAIDLEGSAFEPHYNLALAHAAQGRYLSADQQFDKASQLNLGRLRALSRTGDRFDPSQPVDALWSSAHLWSWTLRSPAPVLTPEPLTRFFPGRSLGWTAPLVLLAMVLGVAAGRWIRRLIHVHVCYQCGCPVCRRCLVRLDRRAYCRNCAEALGGMSSGEATRLLLRRLLEEKPLWTRQLANTLFHSIPGIGSLLYGNLILAAFTVPLAGLGTAFIVYPTWSQPLGLGLTAEALSGLLPGFGVLLIGFSFLFTILGMRSARKRSASLQAFLDRDVDRLAA